MTDNIQLNINIFDSIILGVLFLSAIIAFFRGFLREVFSLGAWVGAAAATLYLFPHAEEFMKHHIKDPKVAAGAASLCLYTISFIVISIFFSLIIRYVKTGSEVGLLDNFLGLIFGGLRGVFVVSLGYLMMSAFVPKDSPPSWLKTSITKPYLKQSSDILVGIAPNYLNEIEGVIKKQTDDMKDVEEKTGDYTEKVVPKVYTPNGQQDLQRIINSNR